MENEKQVENPEESKKILQSENRQLAWVIGIIILCFAIFAGTYLYIQGQKSFDFAGASWKIEDYEDLRIWHGRFPAFINGNVTYNIYLRNDPRTNDVQIDGNLTYFRYGGFLSFTPEVDECRGDVPRVMVDLGSFLQSAVGMRSIEPGTTSGEVFKETGRTFADCSVSNRGVIIVQLGNESLISQNVKNPYCYTITIKDCLDILSVEKFMIGVMKQEQERKNSVISF